MFSLVFDGCFYFLARDDMLVILKSSLPQWSRTFVPDEGKELFCGGTVAVSVHEVSDKRLAHGMSTKKNWN